jgi:hypothetical protein
VVNVQACFLFFTYCPFFAVSGVKPVRPLCGMDGRKASGRKKENRMLKFRAPGGAGDGLMQRLHPAMPGAGERRPAAPRLRQRGLAAPVPASLYAQA